MNLTLLSITKCQLEVRYRSSKRAPGFLFLTAKSSADMFLPSYRSTSGTLLTGIST